MWFWFFLNLLRFALWPSMWWILENAPCAHGKKVYSATLEWNALSVSIKSIWLNMLFKVCVSLFVFWMICPLMYYCHFPFFFWLYVLGCFYGGCVYVYNYYIFFLGWSLDHYIVSFLSFILVFILKSILFHMSFATATFLWFTFAWDPFFHPYRLSFWICPYIWSGSLKDNIHTGLVVLSIQPVCVFWLEHLIHLCLK